MAAYYWTTLASLAALLSTQHQKMLGKCTKLSKTIGSHFIMSVIFCNCCTRHVSIFWGGTKLGFMVRNKTTIIHPHQAKHSKSRLIIMKSMLGCFLMTKIPPEYMNRPVQQGNKAPKVNIVRKSSQSFITAPGPMLVTYIPHSFRSYC